MSNTGEMSERRQQYMAKRLEATIDDLTISSKKPMENRNFILIKTVHSCEVLIPTESFWPLEISLAAFNLKDGIQRYYWTLVDTVDVPVGQAGAAKHIKEATGLPLPGSKDFQDFRSKTRNFRDYKGILSSVKGFVEHYIGDYETQFVLFGMESELESAQGCLQWLFDNATQNGSFTPEELGQMTEFMQKLQFYKLPKLLLRFAAVAKNRNPKYDHIMAIFYNMVRTAEQVLNKGIYDFRPEITCTYHTQGDEPRYHMNECALNIVLRRVFLILREIVPGMLLTWKSGHDIEKFDEGRRKVSGQQQQNLTSSQQRQSQTQMCLNSKRAELDFQYWTKAAFAGSASRDQGHSDKAMTEQ